MSRQAAEAAKTVKMSGGKEMKKKILTGLILTAVLLMSGCGEEKTPAQEEDVHFCESGRRRYSL